MPHNTTKLFPAPTSTTSLDKHSTIALADVIAAMSHALDITEGQPEGHASKSCLIAMKIAEVIGLDDTFRSDLFYGTLLKDAGCSSNAAKVCSLFAADDRSIKRSFKVHDLTHLPTAVKYMLQHAAPDRGPLGRAATIAAMVAQPNAGKEMIQTRCSRGADIAVKLGFSDACASVVRALDEHWNGRGEPEGLAGDAIPLGGRIACLAQTVEVYFSTFGKQAALEVARERSGRWFDPDLVKALESVANDGPFWETLAQPDVSTAIAECEPESGRLTVTEDRLDAIAEGFADVIDAKSPWTSRHSFGVADAMSGILRQLGYDDESIRYWRRAALLHDIGKLGVSNQILDKPGRLTPAEIEQMRHHVDHTRRILRLVQCFQSFADDAAAHHEKLDGSGYSLGWTAEQLSAEAKVMVVADIYDALSAKRPYRKESMGLDQVFAIMDEEAGPKICPVAFEALRLHVDALSDSTAT